MLSILQKAKHPTLVMLASDFNVSSLNQNERHLTGSYNVPALRTDSSNQLLQLCLDNDLLIAITNFRDKERHRLTWLPAQSTQRRV